MCELGGGGNKHSTVASACSDCLLPWKNPAVVLRILSNTHTRVPRKPRRRVRPPPNLVTASAPVSLAVLLLLLGALGLELVCDAGALEALGGDGCLVGHALPHDVALPPQGDLLQEGGTLVIYCRAVVAIGYCTFETEFFSRHLGGRMRLYSHFGLII